MENRMFVKAIKDDGNVDLVVYGRHTDLDTLTLMEVEGRVKNEHKGYLIVDAVNILDRFDQIRGSFSKLSVAMLFLEIAYRSNSGLGALLDGLNKLESWDAHSSVVYFLYRFLDENGVLNIGKFTAGELDVIQMLLKEKDKPVYKYDKNVLLVLKNKLLKDTVAYINHPLNTLKLLRFS